LFFFDGAKQLMLLVKRVCLLWLVLRCART